MRCRDRSHRAIVFISSGLDKIEREYFLCRTVSRFASQSYVKTYLNAATSPTSWRNKGDYTVVNEDEFAMMFRIRLELNPLY